MFWQTFQILTNTTGLSCELFTGPKGVCTFSVVLRYMYVHAKSLQSCPTLCDPMDYSSPGSSVHGISQTRISEWVAMPFPPGTKPLSLTSPALAGRFFTTSATCKINFVYFLFLPAK